MTRVYTYWYGVIQQPDGPTPCFLVARESSKEGADFPRGTAVTGTDEDYFQRGFGTETLRLSPRQRDGDTRRPGGVVEQQRPVRRDARAFGQCADPRQQKRRDRRAGHVRVGGVSLGLGQRVGEIALR